MTHQSFETTELIYDWNEQQPLKRPARLELNDETLRDGLQSPSITDPAIEVKIDALRYMAKLGICNVNIGMPCTSPAVKDATLKLAKILASEKLPIYPNCAARTVVSDVVPIVEISQAAGIPIEASTFIGSSPIRELAEGWDMDRMLESTESAVTFAVKNELPVMFVTEDTTRARPDMLKKLYETAIDCGATRLTIADTVGHITPHGVRNLIKFFKDEIVRGNKNLKLDWHGHNDRGFALANSFAAFEAGADCVHGSMLGIGERVGNTAIDQLLVNLKLMGWLDNDLTSLMDYAKLVHRHCGGPLPFNYPVLGRDAFRTSTGVHASAIIKAKRKGDNYLANRIYSGVPAEMFGREQEIEIGPMCGQSNVEYWLNSRGIEAKSDLVEKILAHAKKSSKVLDENEVRALIKKHS
ncbi:2-isopropylmalate synthase [Candidatus Acetothermia bacterium]|nr:2-isopropylmalate synthase [Candidatus Acetothermia bacterium]MBI3643518.1 2-isopropylmalate synthase [Candidatus Acetothermia bacterium]